MMRIPLHRRQCILALVIMLQVLQPRDVKADGRYAAATLDLGVGARSLALGGAVAALYGHESFRYNPAGLAFSQRPELAMMYAPTFGSIATPMANFYYLGGSMPMPAGGTVSVHWTRFNVDDIPVYPKLRGNAFIDRLSDPSLRPDGQPQGAIRDVENAIYLSFARPVKMTLPLGWLYTDLPVEMPVGLNVKVLRQSLGPSSASGLGIDFGVMLKFSLGHLLDIRKMGEVCLGFSALDFARTTLVWNNQKEERVARTTMAGVSYRQALGFHDSHLTLLWTFHDKYEKSHLFGLEFELGRFALRCGYNQAGFSTGAGLNWRRFRVDYAFTAVDYEYVHRIGCAFIF